MLGQKPMKMYQSTVQWDLTLTDIVCTNSGYAPLALEGLVVHASKVSGTIPDAKVGKYAPGATVHNILTGEWYRNTGTTLLPVFSVWPI